MIDLCFAFAPPSTFVRFAHRRGALHQSIQSQIDSILLIHQPILQNPSRKPPKLRQGDSLIPTTKELEVKTPARRLSSGFLLPSGSCKLPWQAPRRRPNRTSKIGVSTYLDRPARGHQNTRPTLDSPFDLNGAIAPALKNANVGCGTRACRCRTVRGFWASVGPTGSPGDPARSRSAPPHANRLASPSKGLDARPRHMWCAFCAHVLLLGRHSL